MYERDEKQKDGGKKFKLRPGSLIVALFGFHGDNHGDFFKCMDQCQRMLFDFSHSQVMDIIFTIKDITFHSNENIMLFVGSGNSRVPEFDVKVTHYPMNEQKT